MNVREVSCIVNLAEELETKIDALAKHTQNPFLLLPPDLPMVSKWNALLLTRQFVDLVFGSTIVRSLPHVCGFSSIEDVIELYQRNLEPEFGGFFGKTKVYNDRSSKLRYKLMKYHWTAEQLALEYDRQHVGPENAVNTGDETFDAVVNDILVRHGKEAAIAYLLGLKSQQEE